MPDISISYNGSQIASMDASGTKTLLTSGTYCEDDITIQYVKSSPSIYNGEHHQPAQNYTVTVSLTNPLSTAYFTSCTIFEYANNTKGEQIGSIASPTGNTSVTVTSGGMLVEIRGSGYFAYGENSETGGVVLDNLHEDSSMGEDLYYTVTGDGTITVDGIDYDD